MTSPDWQDGDAPFQPASPREALAAEQMPSVPMVPAAFRQSVSEQAASLPPAIAPYPTPPDPLLQPGDMVGDRYCIQSVLGQGGVGITYKAFDQRTGDPVALKALSLRALQDWKQVELFEREAQILQKLNHPAIPRYIDSFHIDTPTDRAFYIAQQLAEGESLAELVKKGWRSRETDVRAIAIQVLEILTYLHSFDPPVIHRDIKPQNLMRSPDGRMRLVDFGAVQNTYYNTFMRGSTVVGTFGYMAPEQFRGQAVPATDLYGLAATLLFLLTWRSPSELPQHRLKLSFRSRVQVSDVFADWLEKMLEPDVGDRFASAQEALAALQGKRAIGVVPRVPWKALVGISLVMVGIIATNHYLSHVNQLNTAVNAAVRSGSVETVKLLLEQGADVNAKGDYDNPPLYVAVRSGSVETVKLLLDHGADVNAKGNDRYTAKGDYDNPPLNIAARSGSVEMVKLLLDHGADVNTKGNDGDTPFHAAARNGFVGTIKLLLDLGADVNAKQNAGDTPLRDAAWSGSVETVKLLLDHGADVNAKGNSDYTPLHAAAGSGSVETVKLLLDHGADVNPKGNSDYTPLYAAVSSRSVETVKLLLDHGADVNAKQNAGNIPLHAAVTLGSVEVEMVKLLLDHGADVNSKGNDGKTPLHAAVSSGSVETVKLLLDHGADVNARSIWTKRGTIWGIWTITSETIEVTALDLAHGNQEMVRLLIEHGAKESP